jgi:hypothetical protein
MHHYLKCHFHASVVQNSWSWPTIFQEWLVLRKNMKSKMMFLEYKVPVICLHHCFWEKVVKSHDVFRMYISGNLPILVSTVMDAVPCLGHVWNAGGVAWVKRRHWWVVRWSQGWGSNEERDEYEPKPELSFIEVHTVLETVKAMCTHFKLAHLSPFTGI